MNLNFLLIFISVVAISIQNPTNWDGPLTFPISSSNHHTEPFGNIFGPIYDRISLPNVNLKSSANHDGIARAVFFAYKSLDDILSDDHKVTRSSIKSDDDNSDWILNSRIISASLAKGRHLQLVEPVQITFQHLRLTPNLTDPTCVFWDFEVSSWSDEGCQVVETNQTQTTCQCDHLTNFALLMRKRRSNEDTVIIKAKENKYYFYLALQIVGYVALGLLCLTVVALAYRVS